MLLALYYALLKLFHTKELLHYFIQYFQYFQGFVVPVPTYIVN